ncbi:4Fe-4S binding protein [Alkaliphilus transvaalensis]|uniref:4Fe-4S binding protein n=1 Tax=Alkaliphilus transvaalensis TaxID=114628 RepID=UPI000478DBDC|nr:4Fe-4S binding protein [Alkaliphilus transvaalensis]
MIFKYLLDKLIEETKPQLNIKNCLHYKNRLKECNICTSICPQKAIIVDKYSVTLNEDLCDTCGLCLGVCPTQAISLKDFELDKIYREVLEKPFPIISCIKGSKQGTIIVPCLNSFHPEVLAALLILAREKNILINRQQCQNCSNENNHFLSTYKEVTTFSKRLGISINVSLIEGDTPLQTLQEKSFSRRELFSYFKGETKELSFKAVSQISENFISEKNSIRDNNRKLLIKALKSINQEDLQLLPNELPYLSNWQVQSCCDGCGFCQGVCPSSAWKVEKTPETIEVNHDASRCSSCQLCYCLCPSKAIIPEAVKVKSLATSTLKYKLSSTSCLQCGHRFFHGENQVPLCRRCRHH